MKTMMRIAAGALAAATVMSPAVALADAPYAQAAALVRPDGSRGPSKNILRTFRTSTGNYCVVLSDGVNLDGPVAIQATLAGHYPFPRTLSVEVGTQQCEHDHFQTIAVHSQNAVGEPRDVAFYLTVS
ncbi:hypothetical protein ABZ897_47330 [Nonomuraea sp. NPDC046802]|uniref:hypothetical protein n=1 Tax=Nonomuraea sp. NPDC046802 TaxID=3154919 RepID=UPI0033C93DF6